MIGAIPGDQRRRGEWALGHTFPVKDNQGHTWDNTADACSCCGLTGFGAWAWYGHAQWCGGQMISDRGQR